MLRFSMFAPGQHPGAAGLAPVPASDARAYQSRGIIDGSPGTRMIPAPAPSAVPQSFNRALHRSSDAPNWWRPSVYFQRGRLEHAPVSVVSDNQMPVPAVDPRGTPAVMSRRPVFLGQTQVSATRVTSRYPGRR